MSTRRPSEAGPHPGTDARRASDLLAELERLAPALAPGWAPQPGGFGWALQRIAARLAEETTKRIDRTAERDAIAFLDLLDLPPPPPQAASGVAVVALAEDQPRAVFAPASTQMSVENLDGEQVTFETGATLRVAPGRIAELVTIDPSTDRIELAPAAVSSLEAPSGLPDRFEVVTFAAADSDVVQVSPAVGLVVGDVLRIGSSAHRLAAVDDDLITLLDPLEAAAAAGDIVTKVTDLAAFDLRNQQRHVFHVGHVELLNLEQQAIISLDFDPPYLARELTKLDLTYTTYGTEDGADDPDWLPLELLGVDGSAIRLAKTWIGTVDEVEVEVEGETNRWVRAELGTPVLGAAGPVDRVSQICLDVASLEEQAGDGEGSGDGSGAVLTTAAGAEGSQTIVSAFHNGTPLSTTSRFYPFGPEPLRFDTFALAAPEALTKRGAEATFAVDLADSSLFGFEIASRVAPTLDGSVEPVISAAASTVGSMTGYGVGRNGYLQQMVFAAGSDELQWYELEPITGEGERILLSAAGALAATALRSSEGDLVVAPSRDGGLVAAKVTPSTGSGSPETGTDGWVSLPALSGPPTGHEAGIIGAGGPVAVSGLLPGLDEIVVFDVVDGQLHTMRVDENLGLNRSWQAVPVDGANRPDLDGPWQLSPVTQASWPRRTEKDLSSIVLIDAVGGVWLGAVALVNGSVTITWRALNRGGRDPATIAALDVRPTATRFEGNDGPSLWVAYARPVTDKGEEAKADAEEKVQDRLVHGVLVASAIEHVAFDHGEGHLVARGSALHANPGVLGLRDRHPVTVGVGPNNAELVICFGHDEISRIPTVEPVSVGRPLLLKLGARFGFGVVLPAKGERLLRLPLVEPEPIDYQLRDLIEFTSDDTPHWVEISDSTPDPDPDDPPDPPVVADGTIGPTPKAYLIEDDRLRTDGRVRLFRFVHGELVEGRSLRYLRRVGTKSFSPRGSVDAGDRTTLQLEVGDSQTKAEHRLLIGDVSYAITALDTDEGVATLDRPVSGTAATVTYRPMFDLGQATVLRSNLATLAEFADTSADDLPSRLRFSDGADPAVQTLGQAWRRDDDTFVQLTRGWRTPPLRAGQAVDADDAATTSSAWTVDVFKRGYQNPDLSWEYHDGEGWRRLETGFRDGTNDLSSSGSITFIVPSDLTTSEIGGKEDHWIRARLIGGDYGRPSYVLTTTEDGGVTTQAIEVDTSGLRPPEILSIEASFEVLEPAPAETVLVANNLAVDNQTQAALVAEARFDLFAGAASIDPDASERAIFVGLSTPPGLGALVLLVDAIDQPDGGPLRVDLRTPGGWRRLPVDDRTSSLRRRGMVTLTVDVEPVLVRLFGRDRVWIRLRPEADGADDWAPVVNGLRLNAVEITQARTIEGEILGSSLGEPGLRVELSEQPVLPDTVVVRVRERLGAEERQELESAEIEAGIEGGVVVPGTDELPGTWVLWRRVDSFVGQGSDARVYLLDPGTGRITFGDGRDGKIPPAGRDGIRAFRYQQGGGETGNLAAWSPAKLLSSVEGVESAVLPIETAGGFRGGDAGSLFATGPERVRHAGQAMAPADIEAIAVAASPDIVRARCRAPEGPGRPLRVTISTVGDSRCPQPSLAMRDAVNQLIRDRGWGGLSAEGIEVRGPVYVRAAVSVRLLADADRLAEVERQVGELLVAYLHPVVGGPDGRGLPFGHGPTSSDLLRAVAGVDGLDRVDEVQVSAVGGGPVEQLPPDGLLCAETTDITVVVEPVEVRA